jgi:hypothetical protein
MFQILLRKKNISTCLSLRMSLFSPLPISEAEIGLKKTRVQLLSLAGISFDRAGLKLKENIQKCMHFIGPIKDINSSFRIR